MAEILTTRDSRRLVAESNERNGQLLMASGAMILGTIGVFVHESHAEALTAVWFRCAFGAIALLVWAIATGRVAQLNLVGNKCLIVISASLLMVLSWVLFFAAMNRTSIGVATVVFHIQPLWVLGLAAWLLDEAVSRVQVIAVFLALAGLALATGLFDPEHRASTSTATYASGITMCLVGSICYAGVTLIAKASKTVTPVALAWWQCAIGTIALLWWPLDNGWPSFGISWVWLVGLGVIHSGLAYVLMYAGMNKLSAGRIALLQFVYPATALLVDWAVYGRKLSPLQALGVSVMAMALWTLRRTPSH